MLIYILDEQFRKIDLLRKYTFSQYSDMFRDIGTFTINARIVNENLYLLDKDRQFYVLFDERLIGQVENVQRDSDSEYEKVIAITGKLSLVLFRNRVINGTLKFKGYTFEYVQELVRSQITADGGSKRYVPIDIGIRGNEEHIASMREKCSVVDKQVTGGYIWDEIKAALEQDSLGLFFTPKGTDLVASTTDGIEQWALSISDGVDRTKGNTVGNTPVIFSQSLSNISRTTYIIDRQQYRNVAYVAGEGEDTDRRWYEVYSSEEEETKSGWDRKELWIDARDIQSVDADGGTLTEGEYEEAIKQRANEKFVETQVNETYTATITAANKQYTYGVDYNKGDWVTVVDDELGIEIDVQITEVIKSVQGSQEIVDIGFTYGVIKRGTDEKVEQIESKVEQISNDIKYIENKSKDVESEIKQIKEDLEQKEPEQKRVNAHNIYYKNGYDCFLHVVNTSALDVVITLSKNYRPVGGSVTVCGWCRNLTSNRYYPCVGVFRSNGEWDYVSALDDFESTTPYYIYNPSGSVDRRSNFNLWLSGAWATATNGS